MVIVAALLVSGITALIALIGGGAAIDRAPPGSRLFALGALHLAVEAAAGALLVAGASLVAVAGQHRLGWMLAYFGLLGILVLGVEVNLR